MTRTLRRHAIKSLPAVAALALTSISNAQRSSFQGLGQHGLRPNGGSDAYAVSADGQVIAGRVVTGRDLPFRWTATTSFQIIEPPPYGARDWYTTALSTDGSVIVGYSYRFNSQPAQPYRAFRWTEATGTVDLGTLPGSTDATALSVSGDGSIIVGNCWNAVSYVPFVWTQAGGMQPFQPGNWQETAVISADGATMVGYGDNSPVRWTAAAGVHEFPGPWPVTGVSGDGTVVLGELSRWTLAGGPHLLETIPGAVSTWARALSTDGRVAVGNSNVSPSHTNPHAWVWDESRGARRLLDALESEYGLDLSGWELQWAYGVNGDGTVIVGFGVGPCLNEAFMARLGTAPPCYADCDGDLALNVADFLCFQTRLLAGNGFADCNHDCRYNVNDLVCFQTRFAAGCP